MHRVGDTLRIDVIVSPRASRTRIMGVHDDRLKIQLAAPPTDGQANDALIRFIAKTLGVPRAQLELVTGAANKRKSIGISGVSAHQVILRLSPSSGK